MDTGVDKNRPRRLDRQRRTITGPAWVGGRVVSPFYITEGIPYRPELILWLEMPDAIAVSFHLSKPQEAPISFGASLLQAIEAPMMGPPRRPGTVRVSDARLAAEVRQVLPGVRIVEAPTPEIDELFEQMSRSGLAGDSEEGGAGEIDGAIEPSYFEDGRVGIEAVEHLFHSARVLYRMAPWKVASDSQLLRVDIPAYDVEGACLSIIGALGESMGFLLFPSLEGYERFLAGAEAHGTPGAPIDMGTTFLSLNYEAGSELPATMYREALEHEWPVADPMAYPMVQHRDPDAVLRPLTERDVRVVACCAAFLGAFFVKHRSLFERDVFEPICESFFDEDDIEVRFTAPYEGGAEFAVNTSHDPLAAMPGLRTSSAPGSAIAKVGRNQPCPCGSGKKYKHCCLPRTQGEARKHSPAPNTGHATAPESLDRTLVDRMSRYAKHRFGSNWMADAAEVFRDRTDPEALLSPWAFYHHLFAGKSIAQWFGEDHADRLSPNDLAWLNAQRAAWLSVWEVTDVEPGETLTLKDLLTDKTRLVQERSGSKSLVKRDALLGRVVDYQGKSALYGVYHRPLSPEDANVVVQRSRRRLRRKSSIPVERLREEAIGRYLIACWEEALADADDRTSRPPTLVNTDGDPLLITGDHFTFDPADRTSIQDRLAAAGGEEEEEEPSDDRDPEQVYVFSKPGNQVHASWDNTVIGRVILARNTLRVETNSINRADSLRRTLESSLGSLIRHRAREHSDPMASIGRMSGMSGAPAKPATPSPPSDEMDRLLLEWKAKHYADWIDHPIPALGGETARAVARTKSGREQVDILLKGMENREARLPAGQRFDFGPIRRELGLEEGR